MNIGSVKRGGVGLLLGLVLGLVLVACGGGGGEPAVGSPGTGTIGPAGGRVATDDGAAVIFPARALAADVQVALRKESTGAPPLPPQAQAAGPVYTITPHGGGFDVHAEVVIPVERSQVADNEQLLLVTAQPGDAQWTVLSGATYSNGALRAPVMHFSYFRAIVIVDMVMPTLSTTISDGTLFRPHQLARTNNVGGPGIGLISPDHEFTDENGEFDWTNIVFDARLTYAPPAREIATRLPGAAPVQLCRPVSMGHDGAQWRVLRDGAAISLAAVRHHPVRPYSEDLYARQPGDATAVGRLLDTGRDAAGFGAIHFYGDSAVPSRGDFMPAGSSDAWAAPPAGNSVYDDTYLWNGRMLFRPAEHNGRIRIEASVPTDCNLSVQAVPIGFRLNLVSAWASNPHGGGLVNAGYRGVEAQIGVLAVGNGDTAVLPFMEAVADSSQSIRWEFSTDRINWQGVVVPAERIRQGTDEPALDGLRPYLKRPYSIVIANTQPGDAGFYRAWACAKPTGAFCYSHAPVQLVVHTGPPVVRRQPVAQTVTVGQQATFSAGAIASGPGGDVFNEVTNPRVQWQRRPLAEAAFNIGGWTNIPGATEREFAFPGATSSSYTTAPVTAADHGYLYRALFTTPLGTTATDAALLLVVAPQQVQSPIVTGQPASQNVVVGSTATFIATVTGSQPMNYQWRRNGVNLPGANSLTLTLPNVGLQDDASYDLVVVNQGGNATTTAARLTVSPGAGQPLPPQILASPASISVAQGQAANFAVAVSGTGPYTYQWLRNGAPIAGGTQAAFTLSPVTVDDAGSYSVRVTNAQGSATSAAASLNVTASDPPVNTPPAIAMQPISLAVPPGAGATLAVAASGTGPLTYQWLRNASPVAGATGPMLHLPAVSALDAGQYTVVVTNAAGTASGGPAELVVVGAPSINAQPLDATAISGGTATFSVTATGDAPRYLWLRNGLAIDGATASSYTTAPLTTADSGAAYSVIVYNTAGVAASGRAVLTVVQASAFPAGAVPLRATHQQFGQELWISDGSTAGTTLVRDIRPGPNGSAPSGFTRVGPYVLFSADDGTSGAELWRSDGTEAGTVRVADLRAGAEGSFPSGLIACNGRLFFGAHDGSTAGVYVSDGSAAGTTRLASVILGNYDPVGCLDGVVYFHGAVAGSGSELWRSDGTPAGTSLLADIVPGASSSNPEGFTTMGGQLYFKAAGALWRTDGSAAGTVRVSAEGINPSAIAAIGGTLYFAAEAAGTGREPWKSDGTAAGTTMIADLVPGPGSSYPYKFTGSGGGVFFAANPSSSAPAQLFRTDGSASGTVSLTPGLRHVAAYGLSILDIDGTLYFSAAASGTDVELWKTDGTPGGTLQVAELFSGSSGSYPQGFVALGGLLYFTATTLDLGSELWRSDGSSAGTSLVSDMCSGCSGNPQPR